MTDAAVPPPTSEPRGFGGWLLLLAFGVCLSPFRTLVEFVKEFEDLGRAWMVPNGHTLVGCTTPPRVVELDRTGHVVSQYQPEQAVIQATRR